MVRLDNFSIKIISLEKDFAKRNFVLHQLEDLGLLKFVQIIDAVDGKFLSGELQNSINSTQTPFEATKFYRPLSSSEIGCSLSHLSIYKSLNEGDICLVLEDDVIISTELVEFIGSIEKLSTNWDLILLGHQVMRVRGVRTSVWGRKKLGKFTIGKPVELACGTYGYLICYKGASKLIRALKTLRAPIDHYTGTTDIVNLYALTQPIIEFSKELANHSSINYERKLAESKGVENNNLQSFKSHLKTFCLYQSIKVLILKSIQIIEYFRIFRVIRFYR